MIDKNNTGVENTGHYNSGNRNSGDYNSGDYNSGYRNSGHYNSGNYNSGYRNSGHYNSGNYNSGYFNTDTPCVRIFNVQTDITFEKFNEKYNLFADIPLNRWVNKENMTDIEKAKVNGWDTMGGYLKTLPFKEACQIWWKENPDDHERFTSLPHFNADIFKEITGIDITDKGEVIEIEGKKYTLSEIKKALGN